jgi:hypothetical protein
MKELKPEIGLHLNLHAMLDVGPASEAFLLQIQVATIHIWFDRMKNLKTEAEAVAFVPSSIPHNVGSLRRGGWGLVVVVKCSCHGFAYKRKGANYKVCNFFSLAAFAFRFERGRLGFNFDSWLLTLDTFVF